MIGTSPHALRVAALWCLLLGWLRPVGAQLSTPLEVELLHAVPSTVVVSSRVANGSERPEHLVDGKLETAWNSKPGDLVGAHVQFTVPDKVRVTSLRLTAGFVQTGPKGDFFTMNHRITRVALYREDELVGEFPLRSDSRELQTLPVDEPGGTFRLEVTAVLPGSKDRWREVCISELQVFGVLPAGLAARSLQPTVRVAPELVVPEHAFESANPVGPYLGLLPMCRSWNHFLARYLEDAPSRIGEPEIIYPPSPPFCRADAQGIVARGPTTLAEPAGPLLSARLFAVATQQMLRAGLALRTSRGTFVLGLYPVDYYDDPHCSGSTHWQIDSFVARRQGGRAQLVIKYRSQTTQRDIDNPRSRETTRTEKFQLLCDIEKDGTPSCRGVP